MLLTEKECTRCHVTKPIVGFHVYRRTDRKQVRPECIECNRAAQRVRWRKDIENSRIQRRKYAQTPGRKTTKRKQNLKKYGMTPNDYHLLYVVQEGRCAICATQHPEFSPGNLHVDHCHAIGHVRGLLCTSCNNGLGRFKDSPEVLTTAAEYLRNRTPVPQ